MTTCGVRNGIHFTTGNHLAVGFVWPSTYFSVPDVFGKMLISLVNIRTSPRKRSRICFR